MTDPTRHSDLARSLRASLEAARHYRDVDLQLAYVMLDLAVVRTLLRQSLLASDEPLDLSITDRRGLGQMLNQIAGLLQEPKPEPEPE